MPSRNALAAVRLSYQPGTPYKVTLQVWNHSYDHPNPARRSSLIKGVALTQLPGNNYNPVNATITDRYGVNETDLWRAESGADPGFLGYNEGGTSSNTFWSSLTGIYDERCLADPACDARRLQTYKSAPAQLTAYNYLLGPVTFVFDVALTAHPTAVKLRVGHIGGNGGNPATRSAALPDEEFVIQLP